MMTFLTTLSVLAATYVLYITFVYRSFNTFGVKQVEYDGEAKYIACRTDGSKALDNPVAVVLFDGQYMLTRSEGADDGAVVFDTPVEAATALMAAFSDEDVSTLKVVQTLGTSSLDDARKSFREWLYKAP